MLRGCADPDRTDDALVARRLVLLVRHAGEAPFRIRVVSTARAFDASAILAQINSSEMRGSHDEEASRVIRAGTPTANPAWACGLAVGWPLACSCVRARGVSQNPPLGG